MTCAKSCRLPGSFRDPSGFLFQHNGTLFRQVNQSYASEYLRLMQSGLYASLTKNNFLIPHRQVPSPNSVNKKTRTSLITLQPERIPFISYPYEWCFSQLKDAALLTLKIQKLALSHNMTLKDATAYNVQFFNGNPVFVDTLSFATYLEGKPWLPYKQFCQHFLAPLALMAYRDIRLQHLLRIYMDGIPLDLASHLLPKRSYLKISLLSHIHLHAKAQQHFSGKLRKSKPRKFSQLALLGLMDSLEQAVCQIPFPSPRSTWISYYANTNYSEESMESKKQLVGEFLDDVHPSSVWDFGANTGTFSQLSCRKGILTVSFEADPLCVENHYLRNKGTGTIQGLPLVMDLTNPSPSMGWANQERDSLIARGPVDTVLALAIIHHLAISNNLHFRQIAEFFTEVCRALIIEFVPKSDSQVQRLLQTREDIFPGYTQCNFEKVFGQYFQILRTKIIPHSNRVLYLMCNKKAPCTQKSAVEQRFRSRHVSDKPQ